MTAGFRTSGGEGGIRTLGTGVSPYNGLANRRIRPLCHLSGVRSYSLPRRGRAFLPAHRSSIQFSSYFIVSNVYAAYELGYASNRHTTGSPCAASIANFSSGPLGGTSPAPGK